LIIHALPPARASRTIHVIFVGHEQSPIHEIYSASVFCPIHVDIRASETNTIHA